MIFFKENIIPYKLSNGVFISPIPCSLKNGEVGFYLGLDWAVEIIKKGATIRIITKEDLILDEN